MGDDDLDEIIDWWRARLRAERDPAAVAECTIDLADYLAERYMRRRTAGDQSGAAQDLDESIGLLEAALAGSQPGTEPHGVLAYRAGDAYRERFDVRGQAADRDRAIECFTTALPDPPADVVPFIWICLAGLHATRADDCPSGPAQDADLETAARYARAGLASLPGDPGADPDSSEASVILRGLLGQVLDEQFNAAKGRIEAGVAGAVASARGYRNQAIAVLTPLAAELPPDDPDAAVLADLLGRLLYQHYADPWPDPAEPDPDDLDRAIDLLRTAVTAEPDPRTIFFLVCALSDRLDLRDDAGDLDDLITWRRRLIELEDPADPDTRLDHQLLASCLISRAAANPDSPGADLDGAIRHFEAALALAPPGDPDRAELLAGLAHLCWDRLAGKSEPHDLMDKMTGYADRAWTESSPGDEDRGLLGLFMAAGTHERLIRPGAPWDLPAVNRAVEVLTEAEPLIDQDQFGYLPVVMLGHFLVARAQVTGAAGDLVTAAPLLLRALEHVDTDDPGNVDVTHMLASSMSILAYLGMDVGHLDQAIALMTVASGQQYPDLDPDRVAMTRGFLGSLLVQRAGFADSWLDLDEGIAHLTAAYEMTPAGNIYRPVTAMNLASSLVTRFFARGQAEDVDAARFYLAMMEDLDGPARQEFRLYVADFSTVIAGTKGVLGVVESLLGNFDALDDAVTSLRAAVASLPPGHPHTERLRSDLGLALAYRGMSTLARPSDLAEANQLLAASATQLGSSQVVSPLTLLRTGGMLAAAGAVTRDQNQLRQAIGSLTESLGRLDPRAGNRFRFVALLGLAALELHKLTGDARDLDRAIFWLADARRDLDRRPFHPQYANSLMGLANAYRAQGDAGRAHQAGFTALQARARDLLLQTGTARSIRLARSAAGEASQVAAWCFADGELAAAVEALELGRGLVLHASTSVTGFAALLAGAGHADLAREWQEAIAARRDTPWDTGVTGAEHLAGLLSGSIALDVPDDLRARALAAVAGSPAEQRLLAPPSAADLAAALTDTGADALVYLLAPADGMPGRAVVVPANGLGALAELAEIQLPELSQGADGPLAGYVAACAETRAAPGEDVPLPVLKGWQDALEDVCDWAWPAVMRQLWTMADSWKLGRPPRLVLVPAGELSQVPWHAARHRPDGTGTVRYALQDMVISYAASGRQLAEVAARPALPLESSPVVVSVPDTGLPGVQLEAQAIVSRVYPAARYLGPGAPGWDRTADGLGTPAEVLGYLPAPGRPGASVIHFGCHGFVAGSEPGRSYLALAGSEELTVEVILRQAGGRPASAPGGLVSLAACSSDVAAGEYDEALTPATAFLAAGAVTVVGARWNVPDDYTNLLMFMFHHLMTHRGLMPRDALRRAQLWMLDPARVPPPDMPASLAERARHSRLPQVTAWAAFVHQGR